MHAINRISYGADLYENQWGGVTPISKANFWLRLAQRKISELAQLPENWDGYGSLPIQQPAIEQSADVLSILSNLDLPDPQIFPVPGGGVQLEFRQASRELEIEILPDGSIQFLIVQDGKMREGAVPYGSRGEIIRLAIWLKGAPAAAFTF